MKEPMIDGPVYAFPVYSESEEDRRGLVELYRKTFKVMPPVDSAYDDIYFAIESGEPIDA